MFKKLSKIILSSVIIASSCCPPPASSHAGHDHLPKSLRKNPRFSSLEAAIENQIKYEFNELDDGGNFVRHIGHFFVQDFEKVKGGTLVTLKQFFHLEPDHVVTLQAVWDKNYLVYSVPSMDGSRQVAINLGEKLDGKAHDALIVHAETTNCAEAQNASGADCSLNEETIHNISVLSFQAKLSEDDAGHEHGAGEGHEHGDSEAAEEHGHDDTEAHEHASLVKFHEDGSEHDEPNGGIPAKIEKKVSQLSSKLTGKWSLGNGQSQDEIEILGFAATGIEAFPITFAYNFTSKASSDFSSSGKSQHDLNNLFGYMLGKKLFFHIPSFASSTNIAVKLNKRASKARGLDLTTILGSCEASDETINCTAAVEEDGSVSSSTSELNNIKLEKLNN